LRLEEINAYVFYRLKYNSGTPTGKQK